MEPEYLTAVATVDGADPGAWGAHDPTVVQARDGRWVMFSTDTAVAGGPGTGVQLRISDDLATWTWLGHAFDGVPAEAAEWSGASGIWAPEVIRRGGEYRMYYSASSFGSRTSAISLATAPDAVGPWRHQALVVTTSHDVDAVNAIDAAVTTDADGVDWLLYGSFFGGLRILRLDANGMPAQPGDKGTPVVHRAASINGAVEGGHILRDEASGRYFLFCSFDSLFDTYNVRVAASDAIDGPYTDVRGDGLINTSEPPAQVGNLVLTSYEAPDGTVWAAPGHSSHLRTHDGWVLVHHVRDGADPTRHTAHLRAIKFTRSGWPVVSPLVGTDHGTGPDRAWAGKWLIYRLDPTAAIPLRPAPCTLVPDDVAELAAAGEGSLTVEGARLDAVAFVAGDDLAFAGLDKHGVTVWGIKA